MTAMITVQALTKTFGATKALTNVSFSAERGERLAILGENGAGKSTLIKTIAGVFAPDEGTMTLAGEAYSPSSPAGALAAGVSVVYQEPSFFARLSVLDNIFVGREITDRFGQVSVRQMRKKATSLLERLGLRHDHLDDPMGDLSLADQQLILIARAVDVQSRVLILDEPTSILTDTEAQTLFSVVDRLAAEGVTVLYITHRFDELQRIADRFLVLKDGEVVGDMPASSIDHDKLLELMSGRKVDAVVTTRTERSSRAMALEIEDLRVSGSVHGVSMNFRYGEVVGLYGLIGSGRTEVALAAFGATKAQKGRFTVDGVDYRPVSPKQSLQDGIAYLPEDRKTLGIFAELSVLANVTASVLDGVSGFLGRLHNSESTRIAGTWRDDLSIKTSSLGAPISGLSGGHQQKVLLARQLATKPKIAILDEPTRGIDVATKTVIQERIIEMAEDGLAVCVISSELPELLAISDRIYVLRHGKLVTELQRDEFSEERVLRAALGVAS